MIYVVPLVFDFFFFLVLPAPFKIFKPVSFKAFNPCFLTDSLNGFFCVIVSLTTEERKVFAAGFAALKTNGNTLLAMNENIPPPLLFLE